jgi:gliding motility-associated-like protein
MSLKYRILFCLIVAGFFQSFGQLNVYPNSSAQALANNIVGNNIQISNASLNCGSGHAATFTASSTNLGMTAGILLSTGSVSNAIGPNNDDGSGGGGSQIGCPTMNDPQLTAIEPLATYDGCVLQFDIVPVCTTLNINYVFASEEYPEFVNSGYNDAFGFFITGPNPSGGTYNNTNIALLPSSSTPVSIDNVNQGQNSQFYVNNTNGGSIEYDGFTVPLVAQANVTPCVSYHLKLAIADAGDCIYDSGVFLAYKGLTCPQTQIPNISVTTTPVQCGNDGTATVSVTNYTGTPTYQWTPGSNTSNTATGLGPGTYSVIVSFQTPCPYSQTVTATVSGTNQINSIMSQTPSTCNSPDGTATATITGGTGPFTFSWSTSPVQTTATASGLVPGNYTVTISDNNGCTITRTVTVQNDVPSLTVTDSVLNTTCGQSNGSIYLNSISGGSQPYAFSWSSGQATEDITNIMAGNYTVTITDNLNCEWTYSYGVPDIVNLPVDTSSTDERCEQSNGTATINVLNGTPPFTYVWSTTPVQSGPTATGLDAGTYTVTVTDGAGCNASAVYSLVNINDVFDGEVILNPAEPEANDEFTVALNASSIWLLDQSNWPDGTTSSASSNVQFFEEYGYYPGSFWVTSVNGCRDTINYTVFVKDFMTLYVPNAFTPNRDGVNDTFRAFGTLIKSFKMEIFDRWGQLIFETEELGRGWDGTFKGEKVMRDVYVWKIYATDFFDAEHVKIGHVTVVR